MSEKSEINGGPYQYDDYGTVDKTRIIDQDELSSDGGIEMEARTKNPVEEETCFFRDGKRGIDFILVYEEELESKSSNSELVKISKWRQKFIKNLRKIGLEMEEESVQTQKKITTFIKLHTPWDVCCFYAEDLCMRAPLQAHPNPSNNWSEKILRMVKIPNMMSEEVPNKPLDYYTCAFKQSKLHRFLGSDNEETYFTPTQRGRIVWEILATTTYGKRKRAEVGVERLLEEGVYKAAYPLHDGPYEKQKHTHVEDLNERQILYEYWARWGKWFKYQPLDHIREYFGEKIGIYFAWLGFYTAWLLPASVIGVIVFLYGVFTMNANVPA